MSTERSGPDACPGIVAVHQADDGGLVRVRLPGGLLTGGQLRSLAEASVEFGDGNLDLTSRANVQLRGLRPDAAAPLSQRLYDAGLLPSIRHDRVRNIVASPLSGLDRLSRYDVLPLTTELDRRLRASDLLTGLPGRFLFTLDDGRGDVSGLAPDVGIQAVTPTSAALLLAGADTGARIGPDAAVDVLIAAAESFLAEREAQGSTAWRIAELAAGPARILDRLDRLARPSEGLATTGAPRVGQHGRGVFVVAVRLGRLTATQARLLAEVGGGQLRITPWRSVVIPDVRRGLEELAAAGLEVDPASAWVGVTACAGRPGCARSLADVRADAADVVALPGTRRSVHWSGCERRCGRPRGDVADVVATGNGYRLDGSEVRSLADLAGRLGEGRQ